MSQRAWRGKWEKRFGHWGIGLLMIAFGVGGLWLLGPEVLVKYQARGWPEARANVTGARRAEPTGRGAYLAGPVLELRFFYQTPRGRFDAMQEVSGAYAATLGAAPEDRVIWQGVSAPMVPCWYDPAMPSRTVLERQFVRKDLVVVLALLPLCVGAIVIYVGRRAAEAVNNPVEALRRWNRAGWKVRRMPGGGARCELKPAGGATSLASITSRLSPHPVQAIEVLDFPLRLGAPSRFRVLRRDAGAAGAPGLSIDLQAGTPPRGLVDSGEVVWTQRLVSASQAAVAEQIVQVELPDESQAPEDADDWWLRVIVEGEVAVHPPAILMLSVLI